MAELSALELLLGATPVSEITELVPINRLGTKFKIKALTGDDIAKVREQATYPEGSGANRKLIVKEDEVGPLLIAKATVEPNFSDASLLKAYNATDAANCIQKALLAGEVALLQKSILELAGFGNVAEIEEVKN